VADVEIRAVDSSNESFPCGPAVSNSLNHGPRPTPLPAGDRASLSAFLAFTGRTRGVIDTPVQKIRNPHMAAISIRSGSLISIARRLTSTISVPSNTAQHS
jgi:hypothetical protein